LCFFTKTAFWALDFDISASFFARLTMAIFQSFG